MKAINPFSSMAAGANTFFAAIESDIQSGVKNADGDGQVGTTIEALATEREAPATSAEADDVEVGASGAADYELRERLAAAQQQCKKLEQRLAEKAELCGDKDSQLAGVLEEGEQLSKRQAELEKVIRELKQGLREAVAVGDNAKAELEAARQQREDAARQHKEKASSSDGAREEAGRAPAPALARALTLALALALALTLTLIPTRCAGGGAGRGDGPGGGPRGAAAGR